MENDFFDNRNFLSISGVGNPNWGHRVDTYLDVNVIGIVITSTLIS